MMVMMLMMVSPSARQFTRRQLNRHAPDRRRSRKDQGGDREEREEESEEVAPSRFLRTRTTAAAKGMPGSTCDHEWKSKDRVADH
jgi:hypothetical protein